MVERAARADDGEIDVGPDRVREVLADIAHRWFYILHGSMPRARTFATSFGKLCSRSWLNSSGVTSTAMSTSFAVELCTALPCTAILSDGIDVPPAGAGRPAMSALSLLPAPSNAALELAQRAGLT